jgi:hypothetical protein
MADGDEPIAGGKALLEKALAHPLVPLSAEETQGPTRHVQNWFQFLAQHVPLWVWQAPAYARLHTSDLPTTYPLRLMARSILEDERSEGIRKPLAGLPAALDHRRSAIAKGNLDGVDRLFIESRMPEFLPEVVSDLARWEPEAVPGFQPSPYELLAREWVHLIEDCVFATEKSQRNQAAQALNMFRHDMGVRLASHRPREGLPPKVLHALASQGRTLIGICWGMFPLQISDETQRTLESQGVPETQVERWATSLVVPCLSGPEILALKDEAARARRWARGNGPHPTYQRSVVWLLAHRLGVHATAVARKVYKRSDAVEYFRKHRNPIEAHCQG